MVSHFHLSLLLHNAKIRVCICKQHSKYLHKSLQLTWYVSRIEGFRRERGFLYWSIFPVKNINRLYLLNIRFQKKADCRGTYLSLLHLLFCYFFSPQNVSGETSETYLAIDYRIVFILCVCSFSHYFWLPFLAWSQFPVICLFSPKGN